MKRNDIFIPVARGLITAGLLFSMGWCVNTHYLAARPSYLDFITPDSFSTLIEIASGRSAVNRRVLKSYEAYYKEILRSYPDMADGYFMLGIISYFDRDYDQAIARIQKAVEMNPQMIIYYYNLGVIYRERGLDDLARENFHKGTLTNFQNNVTGLSSSKIYTDILRSAGIKQDHMAMVVKEFYISCQLAKEKNQTDQIRIKFF